MTTCQTLTISGIEISCEIKFSGRVHDTSFGFDWGAQSGVHQSSEIELRIERISPEVDLGEEISRALRWDCPGISRKKLLRWRRQIKRAMKRTFARWPETLEPLVDLRKLEEEMTDEN